MYLYNNIKTVIPVFHSYNYNYFNSIGGEYSFFQFTGSLQIKQMQPSSAGAMQLMVGFAFETLDGWLHCGMGRL